MLLSDYSQLSDYTVWWHELVTKRMLLLLMASTWGLQMFKDSPCNLLKNLPLMVKICSLWLFTSHTISWLYLSIPIPTGYWRIAEVFRRVFVLTGIFSKGGLLNMRAEGTSLQGGLGAWSPRKFWNLEARNAIFSKSIFQTWWSVK